MTGLLVTAFLVLLLSALLSAAETAIFSVGESRLRTLQEEGFAGAEALAHLRAEPRPVQTAFHLVNTVANLIPMGLLAGAGAVDWGIFGFLVTLPGAAIAVLLLGELLPRALASQRPIRVALSSAPLLARAEGLIRPLLAPLVRLEGFIAHRVSGVEATVTPEEREVREMTELGKEEGVVEEDEHLLVERAFRLDELTAWEIMTPRVDVFAWSDALTLEEIVDELRSVPYSRVPVYGENVDDVTGILYVREAYETYVAGRGDTTLATISRDPFFVPGSLSLTRLLRAFQARRIHMGIVMDEFAGTDGLVTLEDVLEELVGEIVDETDVDEESLIRITRNEVVADGGIDLREINYALNVSLPQLEHRSLNGFILEELGRVPEEGETIERDGLSIEIVVATETQVVRARIRKVQAAGREGGEGESPEEEA